MNDKQLEKMPFLERCLHCLHVVGERIEVTFVRYMLLLALSTACPIRCMEELGQRDKRRSTERKYGLASKLTIAL